MWVELRERLLQAEAGTVPITSDEALLLLDTVELLRDALRRTEAACVVAESKVREAYQLVSQTCYLTGNPSPRFVVRGDALFAILAPSAVEAARKQG